MNVFLIVLQLILGGLVCAGLVSHHEPRSLIFELVKLLVAIGAGFQWRAIPPPQNARALGLKAAFANVSTLVLIVSMLGDITLMVLR